MTGRNLYDKYCDAAAKERVYGDGQNTALNSNLAPAKAWPFLNQRDRRVWNELARRLTPKPKKGRPTTPVPSAT